MKWYRNTPFASDWKANRTERWHCKHDDGTSDDFDVAVQVGKPLDVLALKRLNLSQLRDYARFLEQTAAKLYGKSSDLHRIDRCPCCDAIASDESECVLVVFEVPYIRCSQCGHVFVATQPAQDTLKQLFSDSGCHSATYVDTEAIATRLQQVIEPKLQWCIQQFSAVYQGKSPGSVIDVGAGGGHFVAAVTRLGIAAEGFELSSVSRDFAREAFGLAICDENFLAITRPVVDLVTFWGLLEYVPEPAAFLAKAREVLAPDGMLVVEVPRADAVGTAVQGVPGAVVARHMDPTTHIQAFSDESLMTLLLRARFRPVAAWYFGMDIYEIFVQAALRCGDPTILESVADAIPRLQQAVDLGRQCDDIIVAAVPIGA